MDNTGHTYFERRQEFKRQEEERKLSEKLKPSIGRVVHYQRYGSPGGEHKPEPSPAIIVQVLNEESQQCQLAVFNPNGMYFNATPYSPEPKPGHWSWPPRVP